MKTLAKSLHTVTVIVRCARRYMECEKYPAEAAVHKALEDLGYPDDRTLDPYDLIGAALAQLS